MDTLYELAQAIINDPNFAATVTNLISNKLDSSEVSNIKAPNKILRTDSEGEFVTNIKGNASTATKLNQAFNLKIGGDFNVYSLVDGSSDITLELNLPKASSATSGIISPEEYNKLNSLSSSDIIENIGTISKPIHSEGFIFNEETKLYEYEIPINDQNKKIGIVQVLQEDNEFYSEINADLSVDRNNQKIVIKSVITFNGRVIYNFIS